MILAVGLLTIRKYDIICTPSVLRVLRLHLSPPNNRTPNHRTQHPRTIPRGVTTRGIDNVLEVCRVCLIISGIYCIVPKLRLVLTLLRPRQTCTVIIPVELWWVERPNNQSKYLKAISSYHQRIHVPILPRFVKHVVPVPAYSFTFK